MNVICKVYSRNHTISMWNKCMPLVYQFPVGQFVYLDTQCDAFKRNFHEITVCNEFEIEVKEG